MKAIFAAAIATLVLASGARSARRTLGLLSDGHESYTGMSGR